MGDLKNWATGKVPGLSNSKYLAPIVGTGLTGLSLYGVHDIINNKKYDYSFNDVYWGLTGLPVYAAYRGTKKIGEKLNV